MQIEDCPLNVQLSAEQSISPPPMLPHAALHAYVKTDCVDARLTRALADFPVAAPTRDIQSARGEDVLEIMATFLVGEI